MFQCKIFLQIVFQMNNAIPFDIIKHGNWKLGVLIGTMYIYSLNMGFYFHCYLWLPTSMAASPAAPNLVTESVAFHHNHQTRHSHCCRGWMNSQTPIAQNLQLLTLRNLPLDAGPLGPLGWEKSLRIHTGWGPAVMFLRWFINHEIILIN